MFFYNGIKCFVVVFITFFYSLATVAKEAGLLGSNNQRPPVLSAPNVAPNADKARGIIVKFKTWPKEQEKALVLQKVASANFQQTEELELVKTFIFTWSEWQSATQAKALCQSLSTLSFVKYCEIDSQLPPDQSLTLPTDIELDPFKRNINSIDTVLADNSNDGLGSSVLLNPPISSFSNTNSGNLKTCGIVPHQMGLKARKLSDYWAQEMIGSDLTRELLAGVSAPQKKLVAVMDSPTREHDANVKNLISGNGQQAVLPNLGNKISIHRGDSASRYPTYANTLLTKVRNECGTASR